MDSTVTIKTYNKYMIHKLIETENPYILDRNIARKYMKYNCGHFAIIDRTGGMDTFLNVSYDSIPQYKTNYSKSFYDISIDRAKEILNLGKHIHVLWSGGFDSTSILASFIGAKADKDQVIVCMTVDSLLESGDLYEKTLKKYFPRYILQNPPVENFWKIIPKDSLIVHGMNGNMIMGVEPYHVKEFMFDYSFEEYVESQLVNFLMPAIKKFPKPIRTLKDFWNFFSFNFYWNANYYHFHRNLENPQDRCISFFGHDYYQDWFISGTESGYKKVPMKNLIKTILGNSSNIYIDNKQVRFSYIRNFPDWILYTSDYKTITSKDI